MECDGIVRKVTTPFGNYEVARRGGRPAVQGAPSQSVEQARLPSDRREH